MFGPHSKQISAVPAWFKTVLAAGWYDPILAESAQFGANPKKKKKKKKPQMQHQRSGSSVGGRTLCWMPVRHPPNHIGASYLETTILAS